jgi:hypothetical protein
MSEAPTSFEKSVLECVEDMGHRLPRLARRYRRMVVVKAMAEHLARAMRTLLRRQVCDATAARRLLSRIESRALQQVARPRPDEGKADTASPPAARPPRH